MDDPLCPPPSRPEIPRAAATEEATGRSNSQLQWRRKRTRTKWLRIPHIDGETDDGVDRISDLPGAIIHHIVSFLPTTEATRVSAVSKTFRSVMGSFPIIDFDFELFVGKSYNPVEYLYETTEKFLKTTEKFLNYVDDTIKRRRSRGLDYCIQKFRLGPRVSSSYVDSRKDSDLRINRAISFAIERGVKELEIDLAFPAYYFFPKLIAKSRSITTLNLGGFKLDLNDLIRSCPMIESLSLAHCAFEDVITLSPNLRVLELQHCSQGRGFYSIKIGAVNLQSFFCLGLFETIDIGIGACKNLKDVALYNFRVPREWLREQIFQLHGLENLVLERCYCVGTVEIAHQNLKSLCLLDCFVEEVEVDAPKLVSFMYNSFMYKGKVVPFRLLNPTADVLDATLTFPRRGIWETDDFFVMLRNFLSSFGHCKVLTLCGSEEHLIFPKRLRDILDSPLCHVKHLKVTAFSMPNSTNLVDGILWLAPRLETLCFSSEEIEDEDSKTKFIKFYRGNTRGGGEDSNYFCRQHLNWCKCHLKIMEMVNFEGVDKDNLLKYFQQHHYTIECQ